MKKEEPQFISLAQAAKMTNYSQDYISLLCRQGKLRAQKLGRNWVTTKDWVYSYVDNTQGKGESIVPVKVKNNKEEKNTEKEILRRSGSFLLKEEKEMFSQQRVFECVLFCFIGLLWLINIYAFMVYSRGSDAVFYKYDWGNYFSAQVPQKNNSSQNFGTYDAANMECAAAQAFEGKWNDLVPFEKETDENVIAEKKKELVGKFGNVTADIYKNFAVVNHDNDPKNKFIYIMN